MFPSVKVRGNSRNSDILTARKYISGIQMIGCDGLNVGQFEFAAGYDFLKSIVDTSKVPFISANLRKVSNGEYAFTPYRIIERDGFRVGITGVTSLLPADVKELKMEPYLTAGRQIIDELEPKTDYIVMLVNAKQDQYKKVKSAFAGADYLFLSGSTRKTRPGQTQSVYGPKEYSSGKQGKYLTQIELTIVNIDSPIVDISSAAAKIKLINRRLENLQKRDPNKSLQEIFANNKTMLKLIADYEVQLTEAKKTLEKAINTNKYTSVPMNRKIKDHPEILSFVNDALSEINAAKNNQLKSMNTATRPRR